MSVCRAVGVEDDDDVGGVSPQVQPRKVKCMTFTSANGVMSFDDGHSRSPADNCSFISAVVGDDQDAI
jgi:hypothetical protein